MVQYPGGAAHLAEKSAASLAPGPVGAGLELSDRDFFCFCQLVHQHAGIHLTSQKKELVRARLTKILRERGLKNFREYYEKVVADSSGAELTCLLDAISTNQTAFWREPKHFQYLAKEILPVWPPERRRPLRGKLWSAAAPAAKNPIPWPSCS